MRRVALWVSVVIGLSGCASTPGPDGAVDPLEPLNRRTHDFNKAVDSYALKPAAKAYDAVMPAVLRLLLNNGRNTLNQPRYILGHLLTGEIEAAGQSALRLTINLVMGAGVLDPATDLGLADRPKDNGKMLAQWGVPEGVYIELPFLGPSVARENLGRLLDTATDPMTYMTATSLPHADIIAPVSRGQDILEKRTANASTIEALLHEPGDSYARTRAAYLQHLRRGTTPAKKLDAAPDIFAPN